MMKCIVWKENDDEDDYDKDDDEDDEYLQTYMKSQSAFHFHEKERWLKIDEEITAGCENGEKWKGMIW